MYAPLRTRASVSRLGIEALIVAVHLARVRSLLASLNMLGTLFHARLKGLTLDRVSLYSVRLRVARILLVLRLPVLAGALTMLLCDRTLNTRFFEPGGGGDPVLFGTLF